MPLLGYVGFSWTVIFVFLYLWFLIFKCKIHCLAHNMPSFGLPLDIFVWTVLPHYSCFSSKVIPPLTFSGHFIYSSINSYLPSVDKRTSGLRKSLIRVYLSQTDNNCQEANSQQIEKMLQKMSELITYFISQRARNHWDWIKRKRTRHILILHRWASAS